jgi:hypothetical protein
VNRGGRRGRRETRPRVPAGGRPGGRAGQSAGREAAAARQLGSAVGCASGCRGLWLETFSRARGEAREGPAGRVQRRPPAPRPAAAWGAAVVLGARSPAFAPGTVTS